MNASIASNSCPGTRALRRTGTIALSLVAFASHAVAQFPLWSAGGDVATGRFGFSAASAGDYDGDGVDDVLVGSPAGASASPDSPSTQQGAAKVLSGKTGAPLFTLLAPQVAGDLFGFAVASLGDVNLDGIVDLAVGAPRQDSSFDPAAGSVSVYNGSTGALSYRIYGDEDHDYFGASIAGLGDTNLDGLGDFAAGAPFADPSLVVNAGRVRLCLGANGFTLKNVSGAATGDLFGTVVLALPDVSSDLIGDFAVGAPLALDPATQTRPGRVTLYTGSGTLLKKIDGVASGDRFGRAVSWLPDSDGDSKPDVVVGATGADGVQPDVGTVSIVSSSTGLALVTVSGTASGESFGFAVLGLGDLDQDSKPDFAASNGIGKLRFLSGIGPVLGVLDGVSGFGQALAKGDDADGDGRPEIVIGSPFESVAKIDQSGSVALVPGPAPVGVAAFDDATPVAFSIQPGQSVPAQTRDLVNTGLGAMAFQVQVPANAPWLKVNPSQGSLSELADLSTLVFNLDLGALPTPSVAADVVVFNVTTGQADSTISVEVSPAAAGAEPKPCVSPSSLHVVDPTGPGAPPAAALTITNCGNPALLLSTLVTVDPPEATWIQLGQSAASVPPGGGFATLGVTFDTGALPPGKHAATIIVQNEFDAGAFVAVPVTVDAGVTLFTPGDKLKGEISDASDVDEAVFFGIEGMAIDFIGGPKNGFIPTVTLFDPDGVTFETWIPLTPKSKNGVLLDRAGPWRLRVEGASGATGSFQVKTRRKKLPAAAKDSEETVTAASTQPVPFAIAALPGAKLDAKLTSKTLPIGDLSFSFSLPNGSTLDASAFDSISGKSYVIDSLPLELAGEHALMVSGLSAGAKLKVVIDLKQPKVGKNTITID